MKSVKHSKLSGKKRKPCVRQIKSCLLPTSMVGTLSKSIILEICGGFRLKISAVGVVSSFLSCCSWNSGTEFCGILRIIGNIRIGIYYPDIFTDTAELSQQMAGYFGVFKDPKVGALVKALLQVREIGHYKSKQNWCVQKREHGHHSKTGKELCPMTWLNIYTIYFFVAFERYIRWLFVYGASAASNNNVPDELLKLHGHWLQ